MSELKRAHILVSGWVQGVAFRYYIQRWASSLSLMGWVRNRPNGQVEAVVEGEETALLDFIRRMKEGPPTARVEALDVEWEAYLGDFADFRIVRYR